MRTGPFSIRSILTPGDDAPELNEATVASLSESMKAVGLLNPITVQVNHHRVFLVAGRHRLEAAKRLKWKEIQAVELPQTDEEVDNSALAEMAEVAENLHRREITALERAELQARWVEIVRRKVGQVGQPVKGGRQPRDKGISRTARDLSLPRKTVERAVRIAKLDPAAKEAAKASGLDDNQSALLDATRERTPEKQVEALLNRTAGAKDAAAETGEAFRRSLIKELEVAKKEVDTRIDEEFDARALGYDSWDDAISAVEII